MPLGTKVGLGLGHFVLDGDLVGTQLRPKMGIALPQFSAHVSWAKRSPISAAAEGL